MHVLLWLYILRKKQYITRTFLICPTKQSNDIFRNLKTLNDKVYVCDDETKLKHSFNNVLTVINNKWHQYEKEQEYKRVHMKNILKNSEVGFQRTCSVG